MAYLVKKLTLVRQSRLDATNCMKQHRGGQIWPTYWKK